MMMCGINIIFSTIITIIIIMMIMATTTTTTSSFVITNYGINNNKGLDRTGGDAYLLKFGNPLLISPFYDNCSSSIFSRRRQLFHHNDDNNSNIIINDDDNDDDDDDVDDEGSNNSYTSSRYYTYCLTSKSGLPVCRYALGGAARSEQSKDLIQTYYDDVVFNNNNNNNIMNKMKMKIKMAPFYFYYNPHRYPNFMKGIKELVDTAATAAATDDDNDNDNDNDNELINRKRENIFLVSGGTDRSFNGMEQRLQDALEYAGNEQQYLDMFVLEYVCPEEVDTIEFCNAINIAKSWINTGEVRYIAASTHSHKVGSWLASLTDDDCNKNNNNKNNNTNDNNIMMLDALMLRYNIAHKYAAEQYSFPVCIKSNIPVLAFTTTRWNKLQYGHPDWNNNNSNNNNNNTPTTSECLSFALSSPPPPPTPSSLSLSQLNSSSNGPESAAVAAKTESKSKSSPVEIVLHSARTIDELREAMTCLSSDLDDASSSLSSSSSSLSPSLSSPMLQSSIWRQYGDLNWNDIDGFDDYPEEQQQYK